MVEYADYAFYMDKFHGNTIPQEDFPSAILRASVFVKYITFGRIENAAIPEEARYAACAAADVMYKDDRARDKNGREKKSENNDGYSVSFVTSVDENTGSVENRAYQAAAKYLSGTGLLYRGLC